VAITLDCTRGFRLPEPTRLADHLAGSVQKDKAENHGSSSSGSAAGS
jgi:hypothetical protein